MKKQDEMPKPRSGPLLTANVPGIGGGIKGGVEDFEVEEIAAYEPSGEGPHFFLWVEKRDVDGRSMVGAVARAYGVERRDVGTAGVKDKRAVTRQWVSVPAQAITGGVEPQVGELAEGIRVLAVSRHGNKLRTGHLQGNRFMVRVRDVELEGEKLSERMEAVAGRLQREGVPNYFGVQRFGDEGSTLKAGLTWIRRGEKPRGRFLLRMAASAVQSEVFNRVLARRLREGTWKQAMQGDIFEKVDSGGKFWIDHDDEEELRSVERRLEAGEIVVTGPLPGSRSGIAEGVVGEMERSVVAELGLEVEDFARFGRRARGARRALAIRVEGLSWRLEERNVVLSFSLPSGSYATVVLREFMEPGGQ